MKLLKKVLMTLAVVFAVFYLITRPEAAAGAVRNAVGAVGGALDSIVTFFTALAG